MNNGEEIHAASGVNTLAIENHRVVNDCLHLGQWSVPELAERVGKTPFFAYDKSLVDERIASLRHHLPQDILLHYAIKANPMAELVSHLGHLVDGFDVASAGECKVALDAGMPPGRISFTGPGKRGDELVEAISAGITINVESEGELDRVHGIGRARGKPADILLRVNPDFALRASGMKMAGTASPFGIDEERVPTLLARIPKLAVRLRGLHIFAGSQCLDAGALGEVYDRTLTLAVRLAGSMLSPPELLNIGGGFGIPYFSKDKSLDLASVGSRLSRLMAEARTSLPGTRVILELGRFIVGEAGIYVCRVVDRKQSRGVTYLVTDGGLHHHLAATGNFGQVVRRNFPVIAAHRVRGGPREIVSVVGPLCTPLDLLADGIEIGAAGVGDLIVVLQSGAYGLTASPTAFLAHPLPAEILV